MRIDIKEKRRYVKPELYPFAIKGELLISVGSEDTPDGGLSKGDQFDFDDSFDDDFVYMITKHGIMWKNRMILSNEIIKRSIAYSNNVSKK